MAREVATVHAFRHDPPFRLAKDKLVVRCDDGAVYEFEQPDGNPRPRFVRSFDADGTVRNTGSNKRLADAVEAVATELLGTWEQ